MITSSQGRVPPRALGVSSIDQSFFYFLEIPGANRLDQSMGQRASSDRRHGKVYQFFGPGLPSSLVFAPLATTILVSVPASDLNRSKTAADHRS